MKIAQSNAERLSRAKILDSLVNVQRIALGASQSAVILTGKLGFSRILALHGVGKIEHSSPFPVWLRRFSRKLKNNSQSLRFDAGQEAAPDNWSRFAAHYLLRLSLFHNSFGHYEWYLFKSEPWDNKDVARAQLIAREAVAQLNKLSAFVAAPGIWARRVVLAILFLAGAMFPVNISTIAPAEVIAADPQTIASSFPAVVKRILVAPNQIVEDNQILVELDDADQIARVQIAKREYEVAVAELRRLSQMGFQDVNNRNRLAEVQGQVSIKQLMLQRAELELARTKLRATMAGVAIVSDPVDWSGRPVQTGEKILSIANPALTRVRLWIPAKDGSLLKRGLTGALYLDSDPWQARPIRLDSWSYEAEQSPLGVIAFRALAEQTGPVTRSDLLGLHGTAHLSGDSVPLIFYLLRRPIIYVRQLLVL